jgi:decaprenylphospho-beta-D-ribofuranose 2-oxidase
MSLIKKGKDHYLSWGNYPQFNSTAFKCENLLALREIIGSHDDLISYGNGRSYGDSALSSNLIDLRPYRYFLDFDGKNAILQCQAGVLLSEILEVFLPRGWFLPVTPGTKLITVGGAIASDVHGKNHHTAGSFSDHLLDFRLMLPDGNIVTCSPDENVDLFRATCGGMGLTGVILDTRIRLKPIHSAMIDQVIIKTGNLQETFDAFERYKKVAYSVAWIDCLAKGKRLGRCLLMTGEHATDGNLLYQNRENLSIPFAFPSFTLNNLTVKAFNTLYYGKAKKGVSRQKVTIDHFFYPLDAIGHWNRIYGNNGFTQYQFVLPLEESFRGLERILTRIAASGKGSFLAVLKLFGKGNANWLSFPLEGYTLALDFKIEPGLFKLLLELDKIVLEHGGRFYLTKDVRVAKENFEPGYQDIDKFRDLRNKYKMIKKFNSLQSKRLEI